MTARRATWLVVPAAVVLALAAGAAVVYLQKPVYEARATIVVVRGRAFVGPKARVASVLAALLRSDLVAANTVSTLRLHESPRELRQRLRVDVDPQALLLKLRVREHDAQRARAVAAEVAAIFVQQVRNRFPGTGLQARLLDGAHADGRVSPQPARDLAISGGAGLLVGAAALLALRRRRPAPPDLQPELARRDRELAELRGNVETAEREREDALRSRDEAVREREEALRRAAEARDAAGDLAEREARIDERVEAVTQRELALARRAGSLQARARALDEEEVRLAAMEEGAAAEAERLLREAEAERERAAAAAAAAAVVPEPPPPEPAPAPAPPAVSGDGVHSLEALERLVERSEAPPEQREEWQTYLYFLREHADASGRLPAAFDYLVTDVFGDLLA